MKKTTLVIGQYLQTIYSLLYFSKPGIVKAVHLSDRFNSSPSTTHASLRRMERDKLITIDRKKRIHFTDKGLEIAENLTRRHRLLETFLYHKLGIPWYDVHNHATTLEHGITPLVEERLKELMDFPKYCPHGMPIPGEPHQLPGNLFFLDEAEEGDYIRIIVIFEPLEESVDTMRLLDDKNFKPGAVHKILSKVSTENTLIFKTNSQKIELPLDICGQIGVMKVLSKKVPNSD